jgi:hypothetical protein
VKKQSAALTIEMLGKIDYYLFTFTNRDYYEMNLLQAKKLCADEDRLWQVEDQVSFDKEFNCKEDEWELCI